jgi:hypothetical protein
LTGRTRLLIDAGFITGLLALSALPLVVCRHAAWVHETPFVLGYWAVGLLGVGLWLVIHRRADGASPPRAPAEGATGTRPGGAAWIRTAIETSLLTGLTAVTFLDPLRRHFWGGFDEPGSSLAGEVARIWSPWWDGKLGRPLLGLPALLGQTLTPDRIEGFLWLAAALCVANSVLLMAIIRRLLPGATLVGGVAAVLLVADRAEPLLFFPLWTTNFYWLALFWLLLALWLLLLSADRQGRGLLAASCASLGAALLTSEGLFPLALLGPLLLWLRGRRGSPLRIWSYAWLGTAALLAVRFGAHLLTSAEVPYQARQLAGVAGPTGLVHNLGAHLMLGLAYFEWPALPGEYWRSWVAAFAVAAAALAGAARRPEPEGRRRAYGLGLGVAALGLCLGLAPFVHLTTSWRTQYFAAPGQAASLAFAIGLLGSALPGWLGRGVVVAIASLLAANATALSLRSQEAPGALVRFEKTAHVVRQIHALSPRLGRDTLVVLVLDDSGTTPLGPNYHVCNLSWLVFGELATQGNFRDPHGHGPTFTRDGVDTRCLGGLFEHTYDEVVAFRLVTDGSVRLLLHLPASLVPAEQVAGRYRPLARLRPGPIDEPRFLRYPSWSQRPGDVLETEAGVMLGENWSALKRERGRIFRWADQDAEIAVNPAGRDRQTLALDVEPGGDLSGRAAELRVLDGADGVVARARLDGGRQVVPITLPLEPGRVAVFRLRVRSADPSVTGSAGGSYLRVFGPDRGRSLARDATDTSDLVGSDLHLRLGWNWHPLERFAGETFRWMTDDAEIVVDHLPRGVLLLALDVAPGPGLRGQPCRLHVADGNGRVVASATVPGRQVIRVALPVTGQPTEIFRLQVEGQGLPTATDPRILNCRVFSVRRLAG